ncbi:hypothetical protein IP69_19700 [Bosea sp. AAP35]|nr:hypothetical protein IP69_19700 [Bosea sp. AAP35]
MRQNVKRNGTLRLKKGAEVTSQRDMVVLCLGDDHETQRSAPVAQSLVDLLLRFLREAGWSVHRGTVVKLCRDPRQGPARPTFIVFEDQIQDPRREIVAELLQVRDIDEGGKGAALDPISRLIVP